ncbi:hypothetical protein TUN199_04548 [Pyrenophora tritici-repentis]|nr:hypothetical protein PtrV1_07838 [Pyrenophora tritici-repentis]KAF7571123.1 Amelogenin multi-domain protein [Pyrenophora tritici-repentis]KAI0581612.1 hypothetical protein Alg215_04602 [Pyrenophora tritici-repentis]KAI0591362.1 hypothetical protein Alg130_01309 [Pyrenophora tritici-repentis]KAI0623462.1 hypothetical protein TUN199_04548 [Pyrenophora tritici-repentis]
MRYGHQHARGPPRGEDGEFKIRGQAEQTRPMSSTKRKKKQTRAHADCRQREGHRSKSPHRITGSNGGRRDNRTPRAGYSTRTQYEHTTATAGPLSTHHSAPPRLADVPSVPQPRNSRSRTSRRAKELRKLATAEENAANYPPLDDTRAWQALGRETDSTTRDNSAFVYRHLRRAQCPKALSFPEWVKDVHREMEGLGLQDTGRYIRRDWQEAGGPVEEIEMVQETVAVQEEVDVVQERKYEDDGFDIDIYGDEETRAKYEPWIRSQIGRGTSKL